MSGSDEKLVFNVGGQRFETLAATLDHLHPQTGAELLNMLVRQRAPGAEIFIDREPLLFRWILYVYRTNIVPDCSTVGVSETIWNAELCYFGLAMPVPLPKRRTSEDPQEQELLDEHYKHHDADAARKRKRSEEEASFKASCIPVYRQLLYYLLKNGTVTLVEKGSNQNGPEIPESYRSIGGTTYGVTWLHSAVPALNAYAKTLGHGVIAEFSACDCRTSFSCRPASTKPMGFTKHAKTSITLSLVLITLLEDE
jgi:hypothetical protein